MTPSAVNPNLAIGGFVLAGGQSRRMGQDKALLELHGKRLLCIVGENLQPVVQEVKVIGPRTRYAGLGFAVVEDLYPAQSPLVGLSTGLRSSDCDWNVFVACDMPCVEASLLQRMVERARRSDAQAIIPRHGMRWEPLCALYHRSCLPALEEAIASDRLSIVDLIPFLSVEEFRICSQELEMFRNLNTRHDWESLLCLTGT